jgi:hypothetical protein
LRENPANNITNFIEKRYPIRLKTINGWVQMEIAGDDIKTYAMDVREIHFNNQYIINFDEKSNSLKKPFDKSNNLHCFIYAFLYKNF